MAEQQRVKSFKASNLVIPLYWTLSCFHESLANNSLLGHHHRHCEIVITEKCARIEQTPNAAEHNDLFAIPVYRVKEFSKECQELER